MTEVHGWENEEVDFWLPLFTDENDVLMNVHNEGQKYCARSFEWSCTYIGEIVFDNEPRYCFSYDNISLGLRKFIKS